MGLKGRDGLAPRVNLVRWLAQWIGSIFKLFEQEKQTIQAELPFAVELPPAVVFGGSLLSSKTWIPSWFRALFWVVRWLTQWIGSIFKLFEQEKQTIQAKLPLAVELPPAVVWRISAQTMDLK